MKIIVDEDDDVAITLRDAESEKEICDEDMQLQFNKLKLETWDNMFKDLRIAERERDELRDKISMLQEGKYGIEGMSPGWDSLHQ